MNTGRLDEVDRWIDAAGHAAADRADGDAAAAVDLGRREPAGDSSLHERGRERGGRRRSPRARAGAGRAASPWRPVGCPVLGLSLHWHGQHEDASQTLTEAVRIARANGNHLAAMHASGGLAAIEYERGDLVSAGARAAEAIALAEEHELSEHWASSLSLAVRGQLLARGDSLEAAEQILVRATELAQRGVASIEIAYSLLALADVRRRSADDDDARRIYDEACKRSPRVRIRAFCASA